MRIRKGYKIVTRRKKKLWSFVQHPNRVVRYIRNKWVKPRVADTLLWICTNYPQAKDISCGNHTAIYECRYEVPTAEEITKFDKTLELPLSDKEKLMMARRVKIIRRVGP